MTRRGSWTGDRIVRHDQLRDVYMKQQLVRRSGLEILFFWLGTQDYSFFWLPKRVNRDISCIATKVRKLQIYPFSFQHTRLEYRPPLASKIQMEIHDKHIDVEHIYIYAYCTSPGPI